MDKLNNNLPPPENSEVTLDELKARYVEVRRQYAEWLEQKKIFAQLQPYLQKMEELQNQINQIQ